MAQTAQSAPRLDASPLALLEHLPQAWHVATGSVEAEAASAAHVVRHAAERLRRLGHAYGEWTRFEPDAYFDLTTDQCALLVDVVERLTDVHVGFYADLLLPSYRAAVHRIQPYVAALARAGAEMEYAEAFADSALPGLLDAWQRSAEVILATRRLLAGDIGFLAANGAMEERLRWRLQQPGDPTRDPQRAPTLTLTFDFPLPALRQPGRTRRLLRARERAAYRSRRSSGHTRHRPG